MRRAFRLLPIVRLCILAGTVTVAACGQTGPLYLPHHKGRPAPPAASAPLSATAQVPARP